MKPPIAYYGGKQRMAHKIFDYFPKHTVYVEPFAGGLALLYYKSLPLITNGGHYREVINDIDKLLINFYKVAKIQKNTLLNRIDAIPYSRDDYAWAARACKNEGIYTDLDMAVAYYINITFSYANKLNGGWGYSVKGRTHPKTWHSKKSMLESQLDRISQCYIECADALEVIKRWDSPQTLFYVDPPYVGTSQGYTHKYSMEQLRDLIATLNGVQGSYVLSGYANDPIYHQLQCDEMVEFNSVMSSSNGRDRQSVSRVETIWIKDQSSTVDPSIAKLFATGKYDCFKYSKPNSTLT